MTPAIGGGVNGHDTNRYPTFIGPPMSIMWRSGPGHGGGQLPRSVPDDDTVAPCATVWVMPRDITQRQLRNDSGEIMRGLDRGETFVVTRHGVPVGELTPLRRHRFVNADAAIAMFRGAPSVDLARLRTDLDSVASQDPSPRA